jgi:hypothetical protein
VTDHEGQLITAEGEAVIWYISGGFRWGVPSRWLFDEIAPNQQVQTVPREKLESYPRIPPDRTVLLERPTGRIHLVIDGKRFWLSPDEFARLDLWGEPAVEVHEALLGVLPYAGLYTKRLDRNSHLMATVKFWREKYRLDVRAFVVGVLSGIATTLLIQAFG